MGIGLGEHSDFFSVPPLLMSGCEVHTIRVGMATALQRFISHIASRWTFIKIRQVFSPYAVPWDCGFVIPWLFSPSNCYFPFQTHSHKMASGGGLRPPPPSLALTSHRIALHGIQASVAWAVACVIVHRAAYSSRLGWKRKHGVVALSDYISYILHSVCVRVCHVVI